MKLNKDCPEPEEESKDEEAEFSQPACQPVAEDALSPGTRSMGEGPSDAQQVPKAILFPLFPQSHCAVQQLASHVLIKQW